MTEPSAARFAAAAVRGIDALSPSLAGAAMARRFFTTQRLRRTDESVLSSGQRFEVQAGANRLVAWSWGRGRTILLVHGWNGAASQLGPFVAPLLGRGFRVVAFDGPAHGASDGRETTLPEMAAAVRAIADREGPIAGVVAHSLGAAAVTVATGAGLSPGRVALVSPAINPLVWVDRLAATVRLSDEGRREMIRAIEVRAGASLHSLALLHIAPRLGTVPALVVHDETDREVDVREGRALADAWPEARLITTRGLGHRRILSDPSVVDAVVEFVSTRAATSRREPVSIAS